VDFENRFWTIAQPSVFVKSCRADPLQGINPVFGVLLVPDFDLRGEIVVGLAFELVFGYENTLVLWDVQFYKEPILFVYRTVQLNT